MLRTNPRIGKLFIRFLSTIAVVLVLVLPSLPILGLPASDPSPPLCVVTVLWTQLEEVERVPQVTERWTFTAAATLDPDELEALRESREPKLTVHTQTLREGSTVKPRLPKPLLLLSAPVPSGTRLFLLARTWARTRNEIHPDVGFQVKEERISCPARVRLWDRRLETVTQEGEANCCTFGIHRYRFRIGIAPIHPWVP